MKRRSLLLVGTFNTAPLIGVLCLSFAPIINYSPIANGTIILITAYLLPFIVLLLLVVTSLPSGDTNVNSSKLKNQESVYSKEIQYFYSKNFRKIPSFFAGISLLYLTTAFFHYFLFGNVLEEGITGARYSAAQFGPSASISGAVLLLVSGAPVLLASTIIDAFRFDHPIDKTHVTLSILGFAMFFASGGRNSFLIGIVYLLSYALLMKSKSPPRKSQTRDKPLVRNRAIISIVWLCIFAGVAFSLKIFIDRASIREDDLMLRLLIFANEYDMDINFDRQLSPQLESAYFVLVYLFFYITHAFTYISVYFETAYSPIVSGGYSFFPFAKLLDVIIGTELSANVSERLIIPGVYYSFPGSLYIDFGFIGTVIFSIFLAILSVIIVDRCLRGYSQLNFLTAFFLTIGAMSPLYSIFSTANGPSIFLLSLLSWFTFGRKSIRT